MKRLLLSCMIFVCLATLASYAEYKQPLDDFMGKIHIPEGIEIEKLAFQSKTTVFAATNGAGLFVSYDAGVTWAVISSLPEEAKFISDIEVSTDGEILLSSFGGGVFISKNSGDSWVAKNNGLSSLFVQSITKTKTGILLCGTYGHGICVSHDGGNSWTRSDYGIRYDNVTALEVMKNGYILAGTYGGGFYLSKDTAKTWHVSNANLTNLYINDLVADTYTNTVYAATNGAGVMMTNDGAAWYVYSNQWHQLDYAETEPLLDSAITCIAINETQLIMSTRSCGAYIWDDVWEAWDNIKPLRKGLSALAVNPSGVILAAKTEGDLFNSTDDGKKWSQTSKALLKLPDSTTTDIWKQSLFVSEFDGSLIKVSKDMTDPANDSTKRLFRSDNKGHTWEFLEQMDAKTVYAVGFSPDSLVFVVRDKGIYTSNDNGKTFLFSHPLPHDTLIGAAGCAFDMKSRKAVVRYITTKGTTYILASGDEGKTWARILNGDYMDIFIDNDKGKWFLVADTTRNDTLFPVLKVSMDKGNTFKTIYYNVDIQTISFGYDGNIYMHKEVNGVKQILISENDGQSFQTLKVEPEDSELDYYLWTIDKLHVDSEGGIYIEVNYMKPDYGFARQMFYSPDRKNWYKMRNVYNGDAVQSFVSDKNGNSYMLTKSLYKRIHENILTPPEFIPPVVDTKGNDLLPVMTWNTAKNAEEYILQLAQTEFFDNPFETNVTADTSCQIIWELYPNQTYYWRVASKTHNAFSKWRVSRFMTGIEAPILISPADSSVGEPLLAELIWHRHYLADHYSVQLSSDPAFENIVFEQENYKDTSVVTEKLIGLKTYYWRVKAFTVDENISLWSETWRFKTITGPPILISPADQALDITTNTELLWHDVEDKEGFTVKIATDAEFTQLLYEGAANGDTNHVLSNLEPTTTYFWQVASVTLEGQSEFSKPWSFTTMLAPVTLLSPDSNAVNIPITATLKWEEHLSGTDYQIQIAEDEKFENIIGDELVNDQFEFIPENLEYYKEYYWKVRLRIDEQAGMWSNTWNFKTGIETTGLISPADSSYDEDFNIMFKWNEVYGAEYYQLQISSNEIFTDLVFSVDSIEAIQHYVANLTPGETFFWRVQAWNSNSYGVRQWSEIYTFGVTDEIEINLLRPSDKATTDIPVYLSWQQAKFVTEYTVEVATDANFANIIYTKNKITATKDTLSKNAVAEHNQYFWRVNGQNGKYNSNYSDIFSFTTGKVAVTDERNKNITIQPNPVNIGNNLTISQTSLPISYRMKIYDIAGNLIAEYNNINMIHIDEKFVTGAYTLVITSEEKIIDIEKFIVK